MIWVICNVKQPVLIIASFRRCGLELQALDAVKSSPAGTVAEKLEPGWEVVIEKQDFKVWKRPIVNSHLYEYRGKPPHNLMCVDTGKWQIKSNN